MNIPKDVSLKYNSDKYQIVRNKSPKVKGDPAYYLENLEGMYSLFLRGRAWLPSNADFAELRAYSSGSQSEEIYKNYFSKEKKSSTTTAVSDIDGAGGFTEKKEEKRSGFLSVIWDVVSPANKITNKLIGMFSRAEYDVVATPSDPVSKSHIQDEELKLWAIKQDLNFLKTFYQVAGLTMQEPDYLPETEEEMKLFKERGGFKPEHAMYIEQATAQSLRQSTWKEIKTRVIKDLIDVNLACVKRYYDDVTGIVKTKYIDPESAAIQYSKYHDFQDSEWAFHMEDYTISELLERGIPRDKLQNLAKQFSGYYSNPTVDAWDDYNTMNPDGSYKYDYYKVGVIEGEWIDCDTRQDLLRTNKYGHKRIIPQEYGEKIYETENAQTKLTDIRKLFMGSWVVGSDVVFDFGESTDYVREGRGVRLSYSFLKLDGKSITRQLKPIYDNFQILWVKYQNALAQAVNQGYAINYDAISSLSIGGSTATQDQIIKRFLDTGILIFKQTDTRGRLMNSNLPVYELNGGLGKAFTEFREGFMMNVQLTEWITGINPLSMGSAQDPNMPVATQEMAVAATNDTLRPILEGVITLKENTCKGIMNGISIKLRYDDVYYKAYAELIGERGAEVLRIASKSGAKFDVILEAKPTDVERKEIYESAKIQLQNGRNGTAGIDEADFFKILAIINGGGSLKLAEMVMESAIRRKTREQQAFAKETQKIQQDGAMQQKQAQIEEVKIKEAAKGEEDRKTALYQGRIDAALQLQGQEEERKLAALETQAPNAAATIPQAPTI